MKSDVLKWDGSDITLSIENIKIECAALNNIKYFALSFIDKCVYCIGRTCSSKIPIIIDELKSIFGLEKLGTHWAIINKKSYILIRGNISKCGHIIEEVTLKDLPMNRIKNYWLFERQIQDILAFREILGVTKTYESSIIIRKGKLLCYPLSFYEPTVITNVQDTILSMNIIEKWFKNRNLDETIMNIAKIKSKKHITSRIFYLRQRIEKIIIYIDPIYIGHLNFIIERIISQAQLYY